MFKTETANSSVEREWEWKSYMLSRGKLFLEEKKLSEDFLFLSLSSYANNKNCKRITFFPLSSSDDSVTIKMQKFLKF
jgi:hypothetical protein